MSKLLLLDGHSLAYRAFYALPTDLATRSGTITNAVYGFTSMLIKMLGDEKPEYIAVAFDTGAPTFRDEMDAEGRVSARVIVRHLTVLHGIFRRAMRVWKLPSNPASAELVERPPVRYSGEFTTLTMSPRWLKLKNHAAFTGARFTQPWETLEFPWAPTDQGAAWTNSPPSVMLTFWNTCS